MQPYHPRGTLGITSVIIDNRRLVLALLLLLLATVGSGCSSMLREKINYAHIEKDYLLKPETLIEVGTVTNETDHEFDVDVEQMLAESLAEQLGKEGILFKEGNSAKLILEVQILDYKKGSAYKRWLMPGWGKTDLVVHCYLKDKTESVGTVQAKGSVSWGGGFSAGAWREIFDGVAKDIAKALRKELVDSSS